MRLLQPTPPPYDPLECEALPLPERGRQLCEAWALQGYGAPLAIYAVYAVKVALYVGGWILCCRATPGLGEVATIGSWWLEPIAFQKAILWSMAFEGLGLGCGSGPLTGRYMPPVGGFLYFLRPGTTKLPLFPKMPILGGIRRTWLDVALYLALMIALGRALAAPAIVAEHLWPIVALVPVLALADRTIALALRSEHYWTTALCFLFAGQWIAGAKAVQLALWFWAGVSKLNRHFATVVCVMVSNSPWIRLPWIRRRMYRHFPDDLRPSRLAAILGHVGTFLEFAVPLCLLFASGGAPLLVGMILMLTLHAYITSNVPMGVPIEWNVMVVYGAFALFWAHPEVGVWDLGSPALALVLALLLIGVPLLGNLVPRAISFLVAMRYYAGNWAYGVWLFRGDGTKKLDRLTKSAPWVDEQLARFYDHRTARGLISKVMAFRMMHLHGRALPVLLPRAVPRLEDYEYADGEIVAGVVLGWNFGDGHLHREPLLAAIQAQCGFEPGELRCVFVESQPLGGDSITYRIHDAATGLLEEGSLAIRDLCGRQPWSAT